MSRLHALPPLIQTEETFTYAFRVNVFSIVQSYIPMGIICQAFSSTFMLDGEGAPFTKFRRLRLAALPAAIGHQSGSLFHSNQLVEGHAFEDFHEPVGPMHFQVHRGVASESKMQAGIVAGIKTGLAQNALSLRFPAIMSKNPRANGAAVGLDSFEFDLDPVLFSTNIIA